MEHAPAIEVRYERPGDEAAIANVTNQAFGQTLESRLIEAVRRAGHTTVSMVALQGKAIVGHILFTPVALEPPKADTRVMGLGPMAVRPDWQRRGVGSRLVEIGLAECARVGAHAVVVVGHPNFYPRFGFHPAAARGLRCEYAVPDEAFMVAELAPGALAAYAGTVRYVSEFDLVE